MQARAMRIVMQAESGVIQRISLGGRRNAGVSIFGQPIFPYIFRGGTGKGVSSVGLKSAGIFLGALYSWLG
jgi:hypothetical protein